MNIIFGIIVGVAACWYLSRFLKGHLDNNRKDLPTNKQTPEVTEMPSTDRGSVIQRETRAKPVQTASSAPAKPQETKVKAVQPSPSLSHDDLTRIEGIGPKISTLLNTNGISTYSQLSKMNPAEIDGILRSARVRVRKADAKSWAMQANLAAEANWEDLRELQEKQRRERKGQVASAA